MPFGNDPGQLRAVLSALICAAGDTPHAARMYRRMLGAALADSAAAAAANENEVERRAFTAQAMNGLATICRSTADQLRVRADVTLIAEAMEEAADHFAGLADNARITPPLVPA